MKQHYLVWSALLLILTSYSDLAQAGKKDLVLALSEGRIAEATQILQSVRLNSCKIHWKYKDGNTALHLSAKLGLLDLTQSLLEKGAPINERNNIGATPLFLAIFHRQSVVTDALLQAGAKVNLARNDGSTPLLLATQYHQHKLISSLVKAGACLTPLQTQGTSILSYGLKHELSAITRTLLNSEIELDSLPDQEIEGLLISAIDRQDVALLRGVINYGGYLYKELDRRQKDALAKLVQTHLEELTQDSSPTNQLSRLGHLNTWLHVLQLPENDSLEIALKEKAKSLLEQHLYNGTSRKTHASMSCQAAPVETNVPEDSGAPKSRCFSCWDELTEENKTTAGPAHCNCTLCLQCSRILIQSELTNAGAVSRCPGCKEIWDPNFLKNADKTPQEIETFKQILLKRALAETPQWHFCQTPDCAGGASVRDSSASKYLHCPLCDHTACMECNSELHISGTCEAYFNREAEARSAHFIESKLNTKKFQKCPHCNSITEKNEGCLHMDCLRCKQRWNWKP